MAADTAILHSTKEEKVEIDAEKAEKLKKKRKLHTTITLTLRVTTLQSHMWLTTT